MSPLFIRLIILLFSTLLPTVTHAADTLEPITVQLKWHHQFQFAGLYAAIEQGYFAENGLDVSLIEGKEGVDPANVVVSGQAQYGIGTSELVVSRARGLPVVVMSAIYQHSPYGVAVLKSSGIEYVNDLVGKNMMVEPQAAEILAYLRLEGVELEKIKQHVHSFDVTSLLSGQVDAMSIYQTDEVFSLRKSGVDFQVFTARSGGIDFYGDVLFTTEKEVNNNPQRAKAFLAAFKKGWNYALNNPQQIAELIHQNYNPNKSLDHILFEAEQSRRFILPDLVEFGYIYEGRWRHIANVYASLGIIEPMVDLNHFIYAPDLPIDYARLLKIIIPTLLITLLISLVVAHLYRLNKRLQEEVDWRKQAQRELQAALKKERNLLAILAHDFRTPIAVITAASQLIRSLFPQESSMGMRETNKILSACQRINNLIDSCLEKNHLEPASIKKNFSKINFNTFLDHWLQENRAMYSQRNIILERAKGSIALRGNSHLLKIAFSNLLDNAVKYSPAHGTITLTTAMDGDQLRFEVKDEGAGIKPEENQLIFEKYYRSPETSNTLGAGIGLYAVKEIIESHGGTICSLPDPGGRFLIALPICSNGLKP
ncbi:MAG: ABC transporter substrate-binding protein [Magnetococcales bacterium]|nr:ABC transporter substrate-binding protein [Magnetococcales bacterium]